MTLHNDTDAISQQLERSELLERAVRELVEKMDAQVEYIDGGPFDSDFDAVPMACIEKELNTVRTLLEGDDG